MKDLWTLKDLDSITPIQYLLYYDGPLVYIGRHEDGELILAFANDIHENGDVWSFCSITSNLLIECATKNKDIFAAIKEDGERLVYIQTWNHGDEPVVETVKMKDAVIPNIKIFFNNPFGEE